MINANLVKVSGKSWMPLKTLYIYIHIYIYIHGLIDRIFNTATKPQKLFYLRVILSTCFSAIFSFLTYPKKSLILFYVPVTEYIYIYICIGKPNRQNIPVSSYKGNMVMSEAYMCEYLLNKKITKDISLVVFCINSHQIVYIYICKSNRQNIFYI